jgi:RecQ family ATP-dependent DNA helicase
LKGFENNSRGAGDLAGTQVSTPGVDASRESRSIPTLPLELGALPGVAPPPIDILALLRSAFGFDSFLPNQEAVCRAVIEGRDVLLVMPTGSGKSLCYQLPAIARGGTTLVISPLIALMEDQVAKLKALGFAVESIHSGRRRIDSREACRHYLAGKLQFLFIAPERLRVTGFPEMLAKRPVSLIVVDEAHCISQWGHDFRPDYRRLGQHVPSLRPAPVIALTATATPPVQDDIVEQLGLVRPARFIHGFRRSNIAIEIVEIPPSERFTLTEGLLADPGRRPAIVYTPTRKQAESVAEELGAQHTAAAYHAGLDAERRKQVQEDFLAGKLEIIVATIAFGMGIDKPDIRTVIHTALPASIEGYYQEIGRAGRDGKPSRALLMHSYADRHTHDFFFERNYPDVAILEGIFTLLKSEPQEKRELQKLVHFDPETFDRALEKLWTHGGAEVDYAENVSRGHDTWREPYLAQAEHKREQIERMIRYARSNQCRMASVVRHFGDEADGEQPCGICDYCAPAKCTAQRFRTATKSEHAALLRVAAELRAVGARSTGKLHVELFPHKEMSRDDFENLLGGMARAGILRLDDAVFEKDGRQIPYRTARLTRAGLELDAHTALDLVMKETEPPAAPRKGRKKGASAAGAGSSAVQRGSSIPGLPPSVGLWEGGAGPPGRAPARTPAHVAQSVPPAQPHRAWGAGAAGHAPAPRARAQGTQSASPAQPDLQVEEALRAWRLGEARRLGVPAFRIFTDRALAGLVKLRPRTSGEMLSVPGIGLRIAERYGAEIRRILGTEVR